jgi:hypothetical protein
LNQLDVESQTATETGSLKVLGDTGSLLIIRDLMFGDALHFRELLRSEEVMSRTSWPTAFASSSHTESSALPTT